MRDSKRKLGLLLSTALGLVLIAGCAQEGGLFSSRSEEMSADIVGRALTSARMARANGDLNTASERLAYLASVAPNNPDVLEEYGKVLIEMGRPDDGLTYLNKALSYDSNDWKLYNAIAVAYDEKRDYASAATAYTKALALSPGNPSILANDARSRTLAGDETGAEALMAQASGSAAPSAIANAALPVQAAAQPPAPLQPDPTLASALRTASPGADQSVAPAPVSPITISADTAPAAAVPASPAPVATHAPTVMGKQEAAVATPVVAMPAEVVPAKTDAPAGASAAVPTTTTIIASAPAQVANAAAPAPVVVGSAQPATANDSVSSQVSTVDDAQAASAPAAAAPAAAIEPPETPAAATQAKFQVSTTPMSVAETTLTQDAIAATPVTTIASQPAPAAVSQPDLQRSASAITAAISGERIYIRVATFRSRHRAHHVAMRLKTHAVHIARLTYHGRRYYRVWIDTFGLPEDNEKMLASVRSLGFRDARIIARRETPARRLARGASTKVATREQ